MSNIKDFIIKDGVLVKYKGSDKEVVIPDKVKVIGDKAFHDCREIETVVIPDGVTSIGKFAFCQCVNLTSVKIPDSVTTIFYNAFDECKSLKSIAIPNSVKELGSGVFKNCLSLKKVKIPRHFKNISNETFENCSSLEEIELPEGITSIECNAFRGCTNLKHISFPQNLERINSGAFENCASLSSVVLNEGVTKLGSEAFKLCRNLKDIKLPNSIVEFGREVFANCEALETFIMPDSVKNVGGGVFLECTNLREVVLSSHLREFPELGYTVKSIFKDCNSLFSIIFPKMILKLQKGYFDENIKLSRIYANAESLRTFPQLKKYMLAAYISGDGTYNEEDTKAYELSLKRNAGLVLCHAAEKDDIAVVKAMLSKHKIDASVIIKAIDSTKNEEIKMLLEQYIDANFSEEDVAIAKKDKERIDVGANSYTLKEARLLYQVGKGEKDDECVIRKYKGEDRDEIIIPSFIDNKKVVMIDKCAFKGKIIKKVVIPDTVKEIGQSAFYECCIRELVLSKNLEKIGSYAFWDHELDKVVIPKSVKNMGQQLFDYAKNESFTIYYYNAAFKNNLASGVMETTSNCILLKDS